MAWNLPGIWCQASWAWTFLMLVHGWRSSSPKNLSNMGLRRRVFWAQPEDSKKFHPKMASRVSFPRFISFDSLTHSFVLAFIHISYIHISMYPCIHFFIHACMHSFIRSFIPSFTHSISLLFITFHLISLRFISFHSSICFVHFLTSFLHFPARFSWMLPFGRCLRSRGWLWERLNLVRGWGCDCAHVKLPLLVCWAFRKRYWSTAVHCCCDLIRDFEIASQCCLVKKTWFPRGHQRLRMSTRWALASSWELKIVGTSG